MASVAISNSTLSAVRSLSTAAVVGLCLLRSVISPSLSGKFDSIQTRLKHSLQYSNVHLCSFGSVEEFLPG
ncbi:hypothetical protein RB195_016987 [Necator americanus]|uniref:Uncharacterized protein n=1 Tax=Necator americanus TaxID=51031 RepID=A0ABR1C5J9_NECAM